MAKSMAKILGILCLMLIFAAGVAFADDYDAEGYGYVGEGGVDYYTGSGNVDYYTGSPSATAAQSTASTYIASTPAMSPAVNNYYYPYYYGYYPSAYYYYPSVYAYPSYYYYGYYPSAYYYYYPTARNSFYASNSFYAGYSAPSYYAGVSYSYNLPAETPAVVVVGTAQPAPEPSPKLAWYQY